MANIQFDDDKQNKKPDTNRSKMVGFISDNLDVDEDTAKKILMSVGIIVLLISLYFWLQLIL